MKDLEDLIATVETWQAKRYTLSTEFKQDSMLAFVEGMNAMTSRLISLTGKKDPEFWSAWLELGQQASTMTAGGKTIADGHDRTNA